MTPSHTHSDSVLRGQREVLAQIARGASLREVLTSVARYAEETTPHMLASILYYEPSTGRLRRGGHHTLPDAFADAVDGLQPGPVAGSCGTAAFRRERVVSFDVQEDPLWEAFRAFAAQHNIRSAWSTPLLSPADGTLLGVFGMYYPDTRAPSEDDLALVDHYVHLAAIAVERHRYDTALRESERERHQGLLATAAGLAHELNTPLGVARTAESLLSDALESGLATADPEQVTRALELLGSNLGRAAERVRAFRTLVLEHERDMDTTFEIAPHLQRVVEGVAWLADSRHVTLTMSVEDPGATVRCAPNRLTRIFENLLLNAASHAYGPEGGEVRIVVRSSPLHPDKVEILVSDAGCGMTEEVAQRCTEPFFTTGRTNGHGGLGLFVAKHVTEAELDGSLLLDTAPGAGTRWTLVLTRARGPVDGRPA
jgi:signal transduction histidine kinase